MSALTAYKGALITTLPWRSMRKVIVFLRRLLLTSTYPHTPVACPAWSPAVCWFFLLTIRPHSLAQHFSKTQLRSDAFHGLQAELYKFFQGHPDILTFQYDIPVD